MIVSKQLKHYLNSLEKVTWELDNRSKHPKIRLRWEGGKRFIVLPSTPSDWRGERNALARIKRLIKQEGLS